MHSGLSHSHAVPCRLSPGLAMKAIQFTRTGGALQLQGSSSTQFPACDDQSWPAGPEVLQLVDLPAPALTKGYVLVAVHATRCIAAGSQAEGGQAHSGTCSWCSCNGLDTKVRKGVFMLPILQRLPKCPGTDIAGVVKEAALGSQVCAACCCW